MSDRPGEHEMTEMLDYLSEHPTTILLFQGLEEMAQAYGDDAARVIGHWLEWRREQ